jgi:hypothetical protein
VKHGDLIEHDDRLWSNGWRRFRSTAFHEKECGTKLFPRCRVLVSKERLEQKWPTEKDGPEGEAFRKFAARLADAVQRALAEGVTIIDRKDEGCRCPLGTLTEATHPDAFDCSRAGILDQVRAILFYSGFDQRRVSDSEEDSPYYRLGQAYRARFVTKGNQENV